MDTRSAMQNENFTSDDEKLAEVPQVESQSESAVHRSVTGIR